MARKMKTAEADTRRAIPLVDRLKSADQNRRALETVVVQWGAEKGILPSDMRRLLASQIVARAWQDPEQLADEIEATLEVGVVGVRLGRKFSKEVRAANGRIVVHTKASGRAKNIFT